MAEIKSTLDLVMERTRHLTMTAAEKEALAREEHLHKVPGYVQRFLDETLTVPALLAEIESLPDAWRQEVLGEVARRLIDALDFGQRGARCLQALEGLSRTTSRPWLERCRAIRERFRAVRSEVTEGEARRLEEELEARGIGGSAVLVRGEKSPRWRALEQDFERELAELRSQWRTAW